MQTAVPNTHHWIEPVQARSRAKVERILDAAAELAAEGGSLDLKMTDIAKRAGVAVGTLYQFFPTRSSLLARLFAREMQPIDASFEKALTSFRASDSVETVVRTLLGEHLEMVRKNEALFVIWSSPATDPVIQAADLENTYRNARMLVDHLAAERGPGIDPLDLEPTALLACHLWGSVIRLCIMVDDEDRSASLLDRYGEMIGRQLASVGGSDTDA